MFHNTYSNLFFLYLPIVLVFHIICFFSDIPWTDWAACEPIDLGSYSLSFVNEPIYAALDPVDANRQSLVSWYMRPGAKQYLQACCHFLQGETRTMVAKGESVNNHLKQSRQNIHLLLVFLLSSLLLQWLAKVYPLPPFEKR